MNTPTIRPMIRRSSLLTAALCALALALPACGGDAKKTEVTKSAKVEVKAPPPTEAKTDTPPEQAKTDEAQAPDPNEEKVKTAANVAREIAADPEHADEVLSRHGLDRSKLDALMFEIAADPALTEAYMAARKTT